MDKIKDVALYKGNAILATERGDAWLVWIDYDGQPLIERIAVDQHMPARELYVLVDRRLYG